MEIRKWLPVVEDYARNCPAGDYLRIVELFLLASRGRTFSRSMTLTRLRMVTLSRLTLGSSSERP